MFGSGVPVCAIHFKCINELVKHNENGLIFKHEEELTCQLIRLFQSFPPRDYDINGAASKGDQPTSELLSLKKGVNSTIRWEENWSNIALPLLSYILKKERIPDAVLILLTSSCVCVCCWLYVTYFS